MKQWSIGLIAILFCSILQAKEAEEHTHTGESNIKLNYEVFNFTHSKKKDDGQRYGVEIDHETTEHHFQFYYEKTNTNTTTMLPEDLKVNKYFMKYQYKFTETEHLLFSYMYINDNLMKETNGGNIYGLGYQKAGWGLTQYLSDYPHFDVYQTDLKYSIKYQGVKWTAIGKYIHLDNKDSNNFSKNAKNNYFTTGLKAHTHYKGYHFGAGVFIGKRIFAVMQEGFRVQHHAMEFKETYMCGVGHSLGDDLTVHLRYIHQKAKEVPINNDNVKVDTLSFDLVYKF